MTKKPKLTEQMILSVWKQLPYCSKPQLVANEWVAFESWDAKGNRQHHKQKFELFAADQLRLQAALDKRTAAGRYTLDDAALLVHANTGEKPHVLVDMLLVAAEKGRLIVYPPDSRVHETEPRIGEFYHEAHWDDLNKWMAAELPRLKWRFPEPANSLNEQTTETGSTIKWTAEEAEKLKSEVEKERVKRTKAYSEAVAARHGISASRMRTIIRKFSPRPSSRRGSIADIATKRTKKY